jgi:hypothetical protein
MVSKAEQLHLYHVQASCGHSLAQPVFILVLGQCIGMLRFALCQRGRTASGQTCPTDRRVQQSDAALGARLDLRKLFLS